MTPVNAYGESLEEYLARRAGMVYRKVQNEGVRLQVRWEHGALTTAPYPAPPTRKRGIFGLLVAIYSPQAKLEWIEEDFREFARSLSSATTPSSVA